MEGAERPPNRMAKILLMGEATWHKTGYSNYGKNILEGLQAKGHEVAEVAAFGHINDAKINTIPWKVYSIDPDQGNPEEIHVFNNSVAPMTGSWKFEYALIDFMPDYVISFRDPWIDRFIYESPLRKYFNWIYMPTCDAIPWDNNWVNSFQNADALLTYSTWAFKELQKLSKINLIDVAPSGSEKDVFKPLEKDVKKGFGIPSDTFIVGTVMRNQERKLFPGLFKAFRKFLDSIPKEQASKTKLLCHTSYPDVGWDIPRILIENNVEDNVYFTQVCLDCKQIFISKWSGPCRQCPCCLPDGKECRSDKVIFPNTVVGFSREQLNLVYNAMDIYVQYANCEGLGMPQIEAAYSGLVVCATDYSAMASVVRELDGIPIKVSGFYKESSSHRDMAVPDSESLVDALKRFTSLSLEERKAWGKRSMLAAHKHFDYQKSVDVWDFAINSVPKRNNWFSPPDATSYQIAHNDGGNFENVKSAFKDINLDKGIGWEHMELLRCLNREVFDKNSLGISVLNERFVPFSKQNLVSSAHSKLEKIVFWEKKRIAKIESMKGK